METSQMIKCLEDTKKLLSNKSCLCQGAYVKNSDGSWYLEIDIEEISGPDNYDLDSGAIVSQVGKTIQIEGLLADEFDPDVVDFNDQDTTTTHENILRIIDKTINRLKEKGDKIT